MPDVLQRKIKELSDRLEIVENENEKLRKRIQPYTCLATIGGMMGVTIFCGWSVGRSIPLDELKVAVLVTATVCWAVLVAVSMLRKNEDRD